MSEHARLSISVGPDDHSRGPLDAKLTVVEYGDYQCPYCGQAHPIVERMRTAFADSMRLIFRNLPLVDVHPHVEQVGADVDKVKSDIADGGPRQRVEADFEGAIRSGANGTPTFFVNGLRYDGSWLYEPFFEYLTQVLES